MQEFIISETSKIFRKGIITYAKKYKVGVEKVSILLFIKGEGEVGFGIFNEGKFSEEVTIKDILGVKLMDIRGYSMVAPPYIYNFLMKFAEELKSLKVNVSVFMNENEDDIILFLYDDNTLVREVLLEDIISDKIGT